MRVLLCLIFAISSHFLEAHEYYFAFAEMEWKSSTSELETTLITTTHDFENHLIEKGLITKKINECSSDTIALKAIEKELNNYLKLQYNSKDFAHFELIGLATNLIGTTQFYLHSALPNKPDFFELTFDLLMDRHPDQQNKLTLIHEDSNNTFLFLPNSRTQKIMLD
jgi:hypothetical protein